MAKKLPLRLVELEDRRVPATYTVTTTNGAAIPGSLATAVGQANSNPGADTIIFGSLFDIAQTITLTTGELAISGSLTITGPSAGVTISGNGAGRVFNISGVGNLVVAMSDLTITGGKVTGANQGGGMLIADEAVTLTRCTFNNNTSAAAGGGAAINGGSLAVQDSTFNNNSSAAAGGGVAVNGGSLTVQDTTFSGNSGPGGGAIYFNGELLVGGFNVRNSTLSGNSATSTIGGGILLGLGFKGTCSVQNSTLTANSAKINGGGISRAQLSVGLINIESSIVSGNLSPGTGDDISNGGTVAVNFSAIGDSAGFTLSGANNLDFGEKLLLGPLANNGGATLTHLPAMKSPLMDKGSNPAGLAFDQRGTAYPRALNAVADIGAIDVIGFLIVKNADDSGRDSLRQLISDTNNVPGTHTITFDPEYFKSAKTIVMTNGNMSVTDVLTIVGPGADLVTIDGNQANSVFSGSKLTKFSATGFSASGMTITNSKGTGLQFSETPVAVDSCVITGHSSSGDGGGISVTGDGSGLTILNSTISKNSASNDGGGISVSGKGSGLTISNSTVSNNTASNGDGGISVADGSLTMTSSTVSNNTATNGSGGISVAVGSLSMTSSTVSNNTASNGSGGGIYVAGSGLTILNSTVSNNNTSINGGGIFCDGILRMDKCSIFANTAKLGGGLALTTPSTKDNQTSMEITYSTFSANQATSSEGGAIWLNNADDPGVDIHSITDCTIVNNKAALLGGGIRSVGPESIVIASTIIAKNTAPSGPDIYRTEAPAITMTHSAVGSPDGFALTGFNNLPFNIDLKLGPLADNGGPTLTHLPAANSPLIDAAPPATSYATDQRGAGFVRPIGGAEDIGAVERQELVVRNTNDVGPGSLRQAVADAKQLSGPDTITFDPAVFASAKTITLTSGEILITSSLTLQGPGAAPVTVSGNDASRIFNVLDSTSTIDVFINGITIANGKSSANGGGILNQSENLTLANCKVTNNSSGGIGGGIANNNTSTLTLDHCTIAGNKADNGGGIGALVSVSMTIQSSTIQNNEAMLSGGGLYGGIRNMSVNGSTFTGNKTFNEDPDIVGDGGGLRLFAESGFTPVFRNSTISGNTCTRTGGGLVFETGLVIFQNCTIAKNTAKDGGGLAWLGSPIGFQLESTILQGNSAPGSPDIHAPFGSGNVTAISCAISSTAGIGSFINQGGNLIGQDIKLATLADNGGPTFTHSLLPGSPAINAGSNPAVLKTDQRGFLRSYGGVTDIGSLEVQPAVITVNSGQPQRSRITSITVTFTASLDVTIFQNPGAVTLTRTAATSTGTVGTVVTIGSGLQVAPGAGNSNTITLSFTNAAIGGVEYGSLADGRWQLAIPSVSNYQSPLNDPNLRRLFGDGNADGTIDGNDLAAFGAAFGATGFSAFDFNNDNTVDALDFGQFGNRFGLTL